MKDDLCDVLFAREPSPFGGVTNEEGLIGECLLFLHGVSDWTKYARWISLNGSKISPNQWLIPNNPNEMLRRIKIFEAHIRSPKIEERLMFEVAGIMLSKIVKKLPKSFRRSGYR